LSIAQQCELLGLPRSSYYYEPAPESAENLRWMRLIDEQYLATPFYGSRRMADHFVRSGYCINRKRVQRLMRIMGLEGCFLAEKRQFRPPSTRSIHTCCVG
jgi:putative transposase